MKTLLVTLAVALAVTTLPIEASRQVETDYQSLTVQNEALNEAAALQAEYEAKRAEVQALQADLEALQAAIAQAEEAGIPRPETLWFNPDGGTHFHTDPHCESINEKYIESLRQFSSDALPLVRYRGLTPCPTCIGE